MMNFFKSLWFVIKNQIILRFRIAIIVILVMSPLMVFVLVFRNYEDTLPNGMAEVLYMLLGFGLFGLLIRSAIKSGKRERQSLEKEKDSNQNE